jgi:alpha-glucosidase (family GH31 glycosyl hydrolase)
MRKNEERTRMKSCLVIFLLLTAAAPALSAARSAPQAPADQSASSSAAAAVLPLRSKVLAPLGSGAQSRALRIDGLFIETPQGRTSLPGALIAKPQQNGAVEGQATMPDGRVVKLSVVPDGNNFTLKLTAQPSTLISKWGLAIEAGKDEFFTGIMERLIDGPQQLTWAAGGTAVLNLRGQQIDMILKPTLSVYAPFYISSRGYAVFVKSDWPGHFDFCATDSSRVQIEFEGPSLEMKIYTSRDPAELVREHAMDAGPPFLPPKWIYGPWRWRDENTERATYYDGTPVTGPFNSEFMEDVLMMKAFGIPNSIMWIDRPWGPGPQGYDDFEIDTQRMPNFEASIQWIKQQNSHMIMWIGPFFQGKMEEEALAKGYNLPGQTDPPRDYPMVDFSNPAAKTFWQDGVAKLLKMGVEGFKMDRAEENIPESGNYKIFDGRSIREDRDAYPPMYIKAAYDVTLKFHPDQDFVLMPRAAYTGSSAYGVFWGGDVAGTEYGLRAEIIAAQRNAVDGYPNWGTDTCGYTLLVEQEICGRWLAFSAFTPIMEVGPTRNLGFWDLPRTPSYDTDLIALWRLYARLHDRLAAYSYAAAQQAHATGMPIVRPLFLVDPKSPAAWANWWTYEYGPDLLVSPVWKNGQRTQDVYLPRGSRWRDAWQPTKIYAGGKTITVPADTYQLPLFIRVGSSVDVGDLNKEWKDSQAIAQTKPDLAALDAQVKAWFDKYQQQPAAAPTQ